MRGERPDVVANVRLTGGGRLDPFGDDPVDVHLAGGNIDAQRAEATRWREFSFGGSGS